MKTNSAKHRKNTRKKPKSSSKLQALEKNEKQTPKTREKTPKSSSFPLGFSWILAFSLVFYSVLCWGFRALAGLSWILNFALVFYGVLWCVLSFPRGFSWMLGVLGHFTRCFCCFWSFKFGSTFPKLIQGGRLAGFAGFCEGLAGFWPGFTWIHLAFVGFGGPKWARTTSKISEVGQDHFEI